MAKLNPIKWSGSKAYCSDLILSKASENTLHYKEPFLGSGAVFLNALKDPKYKTYEISDSCLPLIQLWIAIYKTPDKICNHYTVEHTKLKSIDTDQGKNDFYMNVRDRFNMFSDPRDFFFLLRTCFNGLVRFNSSGGFNSPFHHNRLGANPDKIKTVIKDVSDLMHSKKLSIRLQDYKVIDIDDTCFTFLDPPYGGGGSKMYSGMEFNHTEFLTFVKNCPGSLAVTLASTDMPPNFQSVAIKSKSSFKKLIGTNSTETTEMLYWK